MNKRKRAHQFGITAERIAGIYLRCKGYRILAGRYRNAFGEIDLLATRGRTLVAVEVKARNNLKDCYDTITPWKQEKIIRAMQGVIAGSASGKITGLKAIRDPNIRFDVIWVARWRWPVHIKDAWRT